MAHNDVICLCDWFDVLSALQGSAGFCSIPNVLFGCVLRAATCLPPNARNASAINEPSSRPIPADNGALVAAGGL